jgi:hypothetical protein
MASAELDEEGIDLGKIYLRQSCDILDARLIK